MAEKLLNIDGTQKKSFSIGTGRDKIEFISIDGAAYFRNYGGAWRQIATPFQAGAFSVDDWMPGLDLLEGQLIKNNGILYVVDNAHTSDSVFETNINDFSKIADFDLVTEINTTTDSSPQVNTILQSNTIVVTGTGGTDPFEIRLPATAQANSGAIRTVINLSDSEVNVKTNSGSDLLTPSTLLSEQASNYILLSSGDWYAFGAGGSTGAGGGGGSTINVTQSSHGFSVGDALALDESDGFWKLAQADINVNLVKRGVVSEVIDLNTFTLTVMGPVDLTGSAYDPLTVGSTYYLDENNAGEYTTTEQVYVQDVIGFATSTTSLFVLPWRPFESGIDAGIAIDIANNGAYEVGTEGKSFRAFVLSDPKIYASVQYTAGDASANVTAVAGEPISTVQDSINNLNFYVSGATLYIQNKLGYDITLVIAEDGTTEITSSVAIVNDGVYNLGSASSVWSIYDRDDPKLRAEVQYTNGDASANVSYFAGETISDTKDTVSSLNIYVEGGELKIQNKLGSAKTFILNRDMQPGEPVAPAPVSNIIAMASEQHVYQDNSDTIAILATGGSSVVAYAINQIGVRVNSSIIKCSFTGGSNQNGGLGLDTGSKANNTEYYIYAVDDAGDLGIIFSATKPSAGGPTGYTYWHYIDRLWIDGSGNAEYPFRDTVILDTEVDHGTAPNFITHFSNVTTKGTLLQAVQSSVDGDYIEVLAPGHVSAVMRRGYIDSGTQSGISINAPSLTTSIAALAADNVIIYAGQETDSGFRQGGSGTVWAAINSKIRLHHETTSHAISTPQSEWFLKVVFQDLVKWL